MNTMPKRPLHVAHVVRSLEVGGLENGVVNLVNALTDGFKHTVICVESVGRLRGRLREHADVLTLGRGATRGPLACVRVAAVLRRLRPDIVHSRNWPAIDAIPGARLAGVRAIIHGEHGREEADPQGLNRHRNRIRRGLALLVGRFVTVSDDLRRWMIDTVRIPASKVVTIHNGVDTNRFSDQERDSWRRVLGVGDRVRVIGSVGRLDPVKDHETLIRAVARIAPEQPDAMLVIVGDGPRRQSLGALADTLRLNDRIQMLGERDDVARLLRGFDVFVLSSVAEGISNTILEAMATGLPVVATRIGGNPELVEDGAHGRLVPARDPAAMAEALNEYLADPLLRAMHGKASRQRAVTQFDLSVMVDAYRQLYVFLAGRKHRV
jgi:sugar transferase (PEP-CTERM/EpsH1 system associated)